jgi:DNA-binding MarR family transcriptional regulator/N-acetylglutamate synthase-like GNAT family acetyltransferase
MSDSDQATVDPAQVAAVRRFNRFHTRLVGALNERLLRSEYGLPQIRVLYEVANAPPGRPLAAADLAESLGMDAGQLSRIIAGLGDAGLLDRQPSPGNGRRLALALTARGREVFATLDAASAEEVAALLRPLAAREREQLVGALARARRLLGDGAQERTFVLRDPRPGDLGQITSRHGELYATEYGWDLGFEALVAGIVARFVEDFIPGKERCWVAECEGEVVGSVFLVRRDDQTAQLRLLFVDRSARGLGLGTRLVDECLRFARSAGYRRIMLWTNDVLVSARRIYQAAGFELVEEEPHRSFGKDLVGQVWRREL